MRLRLWREFLSWVRGHGLAAKWWRGWDVDRDGNRTSRGRAVRRWRRRGCRRWSSRFGSRFGGRLAGGRSCRSTGWCGGCCRGSYRSGRGLSGRHDNFRWLFGWFRTPRFGRSRRRGRAAGNKDVPGQHHHTAPLPHRSCPSYPDVTARSKRPRRALGLVPGPTTTVRLPRGVLPQGERAPRP